MKGDHMGPLPGIVRHRYSVDDNNERKALLKAATEATKKAQKGSFKRGNPITIQRGGYILQLSANGSEKIIKKLEYNFVEVEKKQYKL